MMPTKRRAVLPVGTAATPIPRPQFEVERGGLGRRQQQAMVETSFRPSSEEATPPAQPEELGDQRRLEKGTMVMFLQRLPTCENNAPNTTYPRMMYEHE